MSAIVSKPKMIHGKTPIRAQILGTLAQLNDQFCFFLFLEHEFLNGLGRFGPALDRAFTTDAYAQNPYARRIYVRLGEMKKFQLQHRSFTFGTYFSTSYEVASAFLDEALQLLGQTNSKTLKLPKRSKEGPEEYYARSMKASGYVLPETEIIHTLSFMRYRRNAIIHLADFPSKSFTELTSLWGPAIQVYWGQTASLIDFTKPTILPLQESETIALLKLLRLAVERLDAHLFQVVAADGILALLAKRLFGTQRVRLNSIVVEERVKRLRAHLKQEFKITLPSSDLETAARSVGKR